MDKKIEFKNEKIKSQYNHYLQRESDFISGCDSDFSKKTAFLIDAILNDSAGTILESDISENIFENQKSFDSIWTNTKESNIPNIVFLKWINISPNSASIFFTEIMQCVEDIINIWSTFKNSGDTKNINDYENIWNRLETIASEGYSDKVEKAINVKKCYIYFVIQNNDQLKTKKEKNAILTHIQSTIKKLLDDLSDNGVKIELVFEDDVVSFIKEKEGSKICIKFDKVNIDTKNNFLEYRNNDALINDSIICNVSARSINKLWNEYSNNLLGLNLRFHVKDSKIDKKIEDSMMPENNGNFWFKNNGLVIICENYKVVEDTVELTNFSIVNGGQTTYNIGSLKEDQFLNNDFFVATKIISVKGMNEKPTEEVYELTNSIAEATNQQKAIKNQDLIANFSRIKEVKRMFQTEVDIKVFVESRRGESLAKEDKKSIFPYKYQHIKAEQLLQIHNAFYKIVPGSCRSGKARLYDDKNKINEAFEYIRNNIKIYNELIVLFTIHSQLKSKKSLENHFKSSTTGKHFIKYGQYFTISSIQLIFILSNDKSKGSILLDKISEWKKLSDSKYQGYIVEWIKVQFEKLGVKRIFACELNKKNIDDIIERKYINLVKDKFGELYQEAFDVFNASEDKVISNFGKTNKEFYSFFVTQLCKHFKNNNSFESFEALFDIVGEKK